MFMGKLTFLRPNILSLQDTSKAYRVLDLRSVHAEKTEYFKFSCIIIFTIWRYKSIVATGRGFFSSPEHDGSYLNHPLSRENQKTS